MPLTPAQRSIRASIAANRLHGLNDPVAHTVPARTAFLDRFKLEADPDGVLPPEERERRARRLLRAHMQALALKSSKARSKRSARDVA